MSGPLDGVKVVEIASIGRGPDMGAGVICVDHFVARCGRRSVAGPAAGPGEHTAEALRDRGFAEEFADPAAREAIGSRTEPT